MRHRSGWTVDCIDSTGVRTRTIGAVSPVRHLRSGQPRNRIFTGGTRHKNTPTC